MSNSGLNEPPSLTIDIRPLLEDVSQVMTKHVSRMLEGVIGEYTTYKETHDIVMSLPCVQKLQNKVSELETKMQSNTYNNSGTGEDENITRTHQANNDHTTQTSSADYSEVLKLKLAIDELTKYIHQLESAQTAKHTPASACPLPTLVEDDEAEVEKCNIHDSENEAVRLEIHENYKSSNESDSSNNEDDDEDNCNKSKNEIVAVTIVHADEIIDETDEDEAEEDAEAEEVVVVAEEEEIEVSEIKIKGKTYFTTNSKNGIIYACVNDDVGDEVGVFKNGIALFNSKK